MRIDLNKRGDLDNQYSEKESAIQEKQTVSPSVMCSPDIGRSNMKDTMNFSMNMWKPPRQISVNYKKKPLEDGGKY